MSIISTKAQRLIETTPRHLPRAYLPVFRGLLLLGIFGIGAQEVFAQAGDVLDEVIVTAQRREESLQETPISITVFNAQAMEARSMSNLMDIADFTPNFEFTNGGPGGESSGQAYIRGIGQLDFLMTTDPGVGIYVDGVYLARTSGNILDLMDIERIEVLRGPQGTLFGKNTIGGAINVVSAKPSGDSAGNVGIVTGRFNRIDGKANVEFPIVPEKLSAKIAVSSKNRDGYGQRLDFNTGEKNEQQGDDDSLSGRGMLRWTPTDKLDILFSLDGTREREKMSTRSLLDVDGTAGLAGFFNALVEPYDDRYLTDDPFDSYATGSNLIELDVWGLSATVDWDLGKLKLKSITAYRELDSTFGIDPDGSPAVIIDEFDTINQDQFSQELQLSGTSSDDRFNWVAGAYYSHEEGTTLFNVLVAPEIYQFMEGLPGAFFPLVPGFPCPAPFPAPCAGGAGNPFNAIFDFGLFNTVDVKIDSYAVFGQGTYSATDKLRLTAGLRYSYDDKETTISSMHPLSGTILFPSTFLSDSWDAISAKFGIDYQWTPELMAYASVSRGFKSGGFNGRPQVQTGVVSFDPEYVWTYEVGLKSELADNRLRLNTAFFFNDYTDIQLTIPGFTEGGAPDVRVENGGDAEIKGMEIEIVALPTPNLQLNAGIGYLDNKYVRLNPLAEVTIDDVLMETPDWSLNAGAQYQVPVQDYGNLKFRGDYVYKSKVFHDAINSESIAQDGYGLVNVRLSFESMEGNWEVAMFGTNLTDERYTLAAVYSLNSLGFNDAQWGRPREWGLSLSYRY